MLNKVKEVETTVNAIRKVNKDIKNYYWMANQITSVDVEDYVTSGTTEYGIEATLPKPSGNSDSTYGSVQRKIREEERIETFIRKVRRLELAVKKLEDEKEKLVIEGCMDRVSFRKIGNTLGVSKQTVFDIKERAVRTLAVYMYLSDKADKADGL